jgi:hypothetical protein
MNGKHLGRYAFVFVILTVSLFSFAPARADQVQSQVGTVAFHLTGQATSMNTTIGSIGFTTLDLAGAAYGDGEGGLIIGNLTGTLRIGSANYSILTGNGTTNRLGEFAIFGQSGSGELILHGIIQDNNTVTANGPPSRISSLAYLPLSGTMKLNITGTSEMNVELGQNTTRTVENMTTYRSINFTSLTQQYGISSAIANSSLYVSAQNVTLSTPNTISPSQTVAYALPAPNSTITTTEFDNRTITLYVSSTVANSTITQTTTITTADTTITQHASVTVSNATVVATNSTNSGS